MAEVVKPEEGQEGWGEILNDALDKLEELSTAGGRWTYVNSYSTPNNENDNLNPYIGDFALNRAGTVFRWEAPEPAPIITSVSPTSGPAGIQLTITGQHFTKVTAFGDEPYILYIGIYESGTDFTDPYNETSSSVWWDWYDSGISINSNTELVITLDQPISWQSGGFWPNDFLGLHGIALVNNEEVVGYLHNAFTLTEE